MHPRPCRKATATSRQMTTAPTLLMIGHVAWGLFGLAAWWMLTGL